MSFRVKNKTLIVKRVSASWVVIKPAKGVNTLYWWVKGDTLDGYWCKADLYDSSGEMLECGILGESLESIKNYCNAEYGLKVKQK